MQGARAPIGAGVQERVARRYETKGIGQRAERPASKGAIRQRCSCVVPTEKSDPHPDRHARWRVPKVANVHYGDLVAALRTRKGELRTWYFCAMALAETKESPNGLRSRST